jgi:hydrogenase maturation factor HypF (carbamoyltransferase family)
MTPYGVYIRIVDSTKPPPWFPHFVTDIFLLQEISYQTYVNGVATSLHRSKKGLCPPFPLITKVCKIENFKQAKDEVGVLTSYKFKEVTFKRHDPQGKLKEHLQQVGFIWSYSHEDLFSRELSQQEVLVKSKISTSDQMTKIDKEAKTKKSIAKKSRVAIE